MSYNYGTKSCPQPSSSISTLSEVGKCLEFPLIVWECAHVFWFAGGVILEQQILEKYKNDLMTKLQIVLVLCCVYA